MTDFQNPPKPAPVLASQNGPQNGQNLKFERPDWSLFRTLEGLQQRAGVPQHLLPRLVLKELADNGLDSGTNITVKRVADGLYSIEDNGPGIPGEPEDIAQLFSIARPMVSTKLLRLPIRGALGNGLRVVAGAVLASGGTLAVTTRNRRIELRPEHDGTTTVVSVKPADYPAGTRITIGFGLALPREDDHPLYWAGIACRFAYKGKQYAGKSSPWWYDGPQFHELLLASGDRPVRELIAELDGCSGHAAGNIVNQARLGRARCRDIAPSQAVKLLKYARSAARQVSAKRLGAVGPHAFPTPAYAVTSGIARFGTAQPQGEIPFVAEVWVMKREDKSGSAIAACVNRTPVTGALYLSRNKRDINAFGCGLSHTDDARAVRCAVRLGSPAARAAIRACPYRRRRPGAGAPQRHIVP
jgi:hypothetical protein